MAPVFMVGTDGSEASSRAAEFALVQARAAGARILVAHGIEWSRYQVMTPPDAAERHKTREEEIEQAQSYILEPMKSALEGHGVDIDTAVRHGHPAEVMAELAKEKGVTQIFIGRHGHTKLGAAIFGSAALALSQTSPVPVVIVP